MKELLEYYGSLGFETIPNETYPQLALTPDFTFEKDNIIVAIVNRSSDTLPRFLVQRFSTTKRIPSKILEIYFLFQKKPSIQVLSDCKLFGVGILYIGSKAHIEKYADSKLIKGRKKIPQLPRTQVFFCSRQNLEERKVAESLIDDQRDSLRVPIYAMLVENVPEYSNDIRLLWPIIEKCMDVCEYVLIILSGPYRDIIDQEARRALANYDPSELLFYVKSDKGTIESYEKLLKDASDHGVKFQEYFDLRGFKLNFYSRLMKIIKELHEENGVPFLESID